MRMTRRTAVLAATTAAAAALLLPAGPPAAAGPLTAPGRAAPTAGPPLGDCAAGQLCLWRKGDFRGVRHTYELSGTAIESCVPVPRGAALSLANRTGRPVTGYQSAACEETGEFDTYPGGGSWVPQSPYQVRAFKIWER